MKRRTVFIPEYIGGVILEVKINREIRNYTEAMFFGLSLRQFIFSILACGVAVGIYFLLRPYVGTETVSWMCIFGAAPFALLGFVKYNGMTAEKFMWAWIKSEVLIPKKRPLKNKRSELTIKKRKVTTEGRLRGLRQQERGLTRLQKIE